MSITFRSSKTDPRYLFLTRKSFFNSFSKIFSRIFSKGTFNDSVIVGLDFTKGEKIINVLEVFKEGEMLYDAYSNQNVKVKKGAVIINSEFEILLLEKKQGYFVNHL